MSNKSQCHCKICYQQHLDTGTWPRQNEKTKRRYIQEHLDSGYRPENKSKRKLILPEKDEEPPAEGNEYDDNTFGK
jgi:hypothetical protein